MPKGCQREWHATTTRVRFVRTHPDPILASIENHKRLDQAWLDLAQADGQRLSFRPAPPEAAETAAWIMARTKSTTTPGVAALLVYITTEPITGLFELGETAWHERTAVGSQAEITGAAKPA
jgi:hypothetical protein